MADATGSLRLGHSVPDFERDGFEPAKDDFGRRLPAWQVEQHRRTILA